MPLFYSGQSDYIAKMNVVANDAFAVTATAAASYTINLTTAGTYFLTSHTAAATLVFGSCPTPCYKFTLFYKQVDGTLNTITWPGSVLWPAGVAPTLTTGINKVDIFEFRTVNGGTTWYGNIVAQNL